MSMERCYPDPQGSCGGVYNAMLLQRKTVKENLSTDVILAEATSSLA